MMGEVFGFIGVGAMGGALARKLMRNGHKLVVCDLRPEAVAPFRDAGASVAATPRDVADQCETVFACLNSGEASRAVALGPDGVIHGRAIKRYIEHSTIGVPEMQGIGTALGQRDIAVLDAPITGGAGGEHGVSSGNFAIIAAGETRIFDALKPVFSALTDHVFHVGQAAGMAQIAKVINNALSITALTVSCEAMVMGVKAGLDPRGLLDAINAGSGRNSATLDKFPRAILPRKFEGSPMSIGLKDLRLYMQTMGDFGLPAPVGASVMEIWNAAAAQKGEKRGYNSIIEHFEQFAHVKVEG
jgi:3-hydroxyisobutyrate dehydrogenase-like beta-hydroxyacid dehydrogenase